MSASAFWDSGKWSTTSGKADFAGLANDGARGGMSTDARAILQQPLLHLPRTRYIPYHAPSGAACVSAWSKHSATARMDATWGKRNTALGIGNGKFAWLSKATGHVILQPPHYSSSYISSLTHMFFVLLFVDWCHHRSIWAWGSAATRS